LPAGRAPALFVAILGMVLLAGCAGSDSSSSSTAAASCDPGAAPTFLASKLDDDDGDGNPDDEEFPTINDEDDDIADHAWIRDHDGVFHLFFHNEGQFAGNEIEHYTSIDLQTLVYAGVALRPNPAGWDSFGLWAPHIVEDHNTYFMFYTGVDGFGPDAKQRIGLAVSTDLFNWTRCSINRCPGSSGDGCVYDCDEPWTTWGGASGSWNQQCRDPFVIRDEVSGRWVLLATARSTNEFGVVTVAYSTNLKDWLGAGFIDATRRLADGAGAQATGGMCENPFVVTHNGTKFLLFTDWWDPEDSVSVQNPRTEVQYATSPTLSADPAGSVNWTYRGYTRDPGVNASEVQQINLSTWIISQSIADTPSGDYAEHFRDLRLKCLIWGDGYSFSTSNFGVPAERSADATGSAGPVAVDPAGRDRH
jgi:hypothetical protein